MKIALKKINKIVAVFFIASLVIFATSCSKDEEELGPEPPEPPVAVNDPIVLDCDYFTQDRTLTDDPDAPVDYIINCVAKVFGSLTIDPGVVIAFEQDAALYIESSAGKITMDGTANKPIVLTGTQQTKGYWLGVLQLSTNPANSMKYVTIEYAGSNSMQWGWLGGFCSGNAAVMDIDHCIFSNNNGAGISIVSADAASNFSITNSVMTGNDYPLYAGEMVNAISFCSSTNSYTGNVNDYVDLKYTGVVSEDLTWEALDVPYRIQTPIYERFDIANSQLVIEPGTEIVFATAKSHIRVLDNSSIIAVGSANNPIIFRGANDVKADWGYIIIHSGSALNEIGFAQIENAGFNMADIKAAVQIDDEAYLNIHDVEFTDNAGYAVGMLYYPTTAPPVIDYNNLIVDNGKKFCSGVNGPPLSDPNDPNSTL